jgi:uncharacterized protein YndB with AHSA1/START domain
MIISSTIEIKGARENVFYWLEDPERAMQWQTSVTQYKIINETPNKVGTTFTEYVKEGGRGTEMRGVVTEFVPNQKLSFHLEGEYNTVEVDFILKEKNNVTKLIQNAEVHFKGMLRVLSILFDASFQKKIMRQMNRELARLKELCESKN